MKARILHIIPTFIRGGAEKQLALLAAGLPHDQFDVSACALSGTGPYQKFLEEQGIPVTVVGKTWKADLAAYLRLRRMVKQISPDIVQTWIFAANCYGRQAAFAAGVRHVIASERCVDPWKTVIHLWIDRHLAQRTSAIVVPSAGVRDFYVMQGIPAGLFHVIPNGIPPSRGTPTTSRKELLAELGLQENVRLIGAVGRLWPQKRWKDAIWGAELLSAVRKDAHLLIVGDGPQRWRLERYRDQVHKDGQVHFLGHRDDVPRLMQHFDCVWSTSAYEGLPNVIMEAMAEGVPVLATDIAGNRDLVVSGKTGYLIPVGDRAEFARRTIALFNDESLSHRIGNAGRKYVGEHFTSQAMINGHVHLYKSLLNTKSSTPGLRTTRADCP